MLGDFVFRVLFAWGFAWGDTPPTPLYVVHFSILEGDSNDVNQTRQFGNVEDLSVRSIHVKWDTITLLSYRVTEFLILTNTVRGVWDEKWEGLRLGENSCAAIFFFNRAWHKFSDTETVFVPEKPVSIENLAQEKAKCELLKPKTYFKIVAFFPTQDWEWINHRLGRVDTSRNKALYTDRLQMGKKACPF